jgi:PAS domain S-box-containing protein
LSANPALSAESAESGSRPRIRILSVDDRPDNLVSLEATLHGLADEIVSATSGAEALRHLLENDFAAILLDVKMPGMDGFETAELIRSRRRSRHTPILFLTGYRSDDQLFRGYDLGAVDFLFKPIMPEILRSKVAVFVELARNTRLVERQAQVLAKAEQKFRSLLEAAPDAMLITTAAGEITLVNSHTQSMFLYTREELLGRNLKLLIPAWRFEAAETGQYAPGGAAPAWNPVGVRKDGSSFPAEISFSPLHTEEGLLITNVIRDITLRRLAEESIRQLNLELEQRVEERTSELMRSNEALREFAWAASHDLKEPLRIVATFSQFLQRDYASAFDAEGKRFLDFILTAASRMDELLHGLREYMQASEGVEDPLRKTDSGAALNRALSHLQTALEESGAAVTYQELPSVVASPVILEQVFLNLVGNAVKYRGECAPRVHVSAELDGGAWVFSVRDNGIGIEPRYHERIFGVFKRLHREEYPGTGIGLAICKAAIDRMGGRIWVESELGKGATFRFTIPAREGGDFPAATV